MAGPRVIDGARSPADVARLADEADERDQQRRTLAAAAPSRPSVQKPKKYDFPTKFVSVADNYLLMLDHVQELVGQDAPKHTRFSVRFENSQLDITLKQYPLKTEKVSELIQKASGYGLGRSFWDAEEADAALSAAQLKATIAAAKSAAKASPEARAALIAELSKEDDFVLKD